MRNVWVLVLLLTLSLIALREASATLAVAGGTTTRLPAGNMRPSITDYFVGTWSRVSQANARIVKSYGLLPDAVKLNLVNSYVDHNGFSGLITEQYTQIGKNVTAMTRRPGFAATTVGTGFDGDTLTFVGTVRTDSLERQRETIVINGRNAFHRTFEAAPVGNGELPAWELSSNEQCRRIVN